MEQEQLGRLLGHNGFQDNFLDDKGVFLKVSATELIDTNDCTVLSFTDKTRREEFLL